MKFMWYFNLWNNDFYSITILLISNLCDLVWNNIEMVWAIQIIFVHVSISLFIPRLVNYFLKDFSTIFHVVKETKSNALSAIEKHKGERGPLQRINSWKTKLIGNCKGPIQAWRIPGQSCHLATWSNVAWFGFQSGKANNNSLLPYWELKSLRLYSWEQATKCEGWGNISIENSLY